MTKAEQTRQRIIEKSAPLFNVKGIAGTAMSDIMEATNLAKGSLYVHFENKDDLAYRVVDYTLESLMLRTLEVAKEQRTAKAKLISLFDLMSHLSNPIPGGCPILNFGMESDDTNQVIRKKVKNAIHRFLLQIKGIVNQGIAQGEFKKDWDAQKFAVKAFAMIEGGVMLSKVSGNAHYRLQMATLIKGEIEEKSNKQA